MSSISSIVTRNKNALSWTVEDMLQDALADVQKGDVPNKKAIVIFLNTENGAYDVSHMQAGLRHSEIIPLLEIMKKSILEKMGY